MEEVQGPGVVGEQPVLGPGDLLPARHLAAGIDPPPYVLGRGAVHYAGVRGPGGGGVLPRLGAMATKRGVWNIGRAGQMARNVPDFF